MSARSTLLPGTPPQGAEAAHLPEGIPQAGHPVRRRRRRSPGLPAASRRTGTHRPPPAHGAAPHPRGALPRHQEPGHLRLPGHPVENKPLVMQLARCEYIERSKNVIAIGNSGTGKTHVAWDWDWLPAKGECRWVSPPPRPWSTSSWRPGTSAGCSTLQRQLARLNLLIIDELASCRCPPPARNCSSRSSANATERGSILVTTNLPFDEWTEVFGSERPHRRAAGSPHPPRAHPGDERRQLPPQGQPAQLLPKPLFFLASITDVIMGS